jgi:hypothetical protein
MFPEKKSTKHINDIPLKMHQSFVKLHHNKININVSIEITAVLGGNMYS